MSKVIPYHFGEIKNCKLELIDIEKWRSSLSSLNGRKVRVVVEEPKKTRSMSQNNLYWVYLGLVEDETGMEADTLHEIFKRKFLKPRFVKYKDQEIKLPSTTTKLSKIEFMEYLDKICAETGVPVPNPEEYKI